MVALRGLAGGTLALTGWRRTPWSWAWGFGVLALRGLGLGGDIWGFEDRQDCLSYVSGIGVFRGLGI